MGLTSLDAKKIGGDDTTIVTCIEAGGLEDQVILLARSLRTLGGQRSTTPMIAVKARRGPPLRRSTRRALDDLGVQVIDKAVRSHNSWWAHANKTAALSWADREVGTQWVTWMDSDLLVLRELDPLTPPRGFDFIARAGEACDVASSGDDERAPFWRAVCDMQELSFDAFPTITSFPDGKQIKAYWQAGLFTFRRRTEFAPAYLKAMNDLLGGSIGSKFAGIYHTDQVSLAIAVQATGMSVAQYEPSMNLNLNFKDPDTFGRYPLDEVKIVHYHGSFWPHEADWAMDRLARLTNEQRAVLEGLVPLSAGGFVSRLHRRVFQMARSRRLQAYEARARLI